MLKLDTAAQPAHIAVEEGQFPAERYKKIHAADCKGLSDPEPVNFVGGSIADLMSELEGFAVCDGPVEDELEYFESMLLPCARCALGLTGETR